MESGDSFDFGSLGFIPIDEGLPFAPPASSPPPPLLVPKHTNGDLPQSAAAVELQGWELPAFSSTPTDEELLLNHLAPAIDRIKLSNGGSRSLPSRPSVVNTGLPLMNPWDLPGMSLQEGRREKYYLTDLHHLCFTDAFTNNNNNLETPDGFWKQRSSGCFTVWAEPCPLNVIGLWVKTCPINVIGHRKTFNFHARGDPSGLGVGSKTNWIMNVYALINEDRFVEDELVLCHVFEEGSPAYDAMPKCWQDFLENIPSMPQATELAMELFRPNRAINAPSNTSFISPPPGSSPMHHGVDRRSDPRFISYIAELENLLLGDPDTSTSTDNYDPRRDVPPIADDGQSRKRKKNRSDVWDYFTKIYARDRNGKVLTFAACNHCFKLMTGASSNGTAHLARHRCSCPCKLQPVAAGRNAQADVNVLSS